VPIGKGGFEPVQAGNNSGGFFKKVNNIASGIFKANQQKQWFDYTQDRKDEGVLHRYAAEGAAKKLDRQSEFDLAHKWVMTHGSDYVEDPMSKKKTRVTRKGVTAGRYNTGQADSSGETYGDKLIKNTELKQKIANTTLEARRLAAENKKKNTTKKKNNGKPPKNNNDNDTPPPPPSGGGGGAAVQSKPKGGAKTKAKAPETFAALPAKASKGKIGPSVTEAQPSSPGFGGGPTFDGAGNNTQSAAGKAYAKKKTQSSSKVSMPKATAAQPRVKKATGGSI
jgi:hypothetical protein